MRSTGEVLGLAGTFGLAFFKSQEATQTALPTEGTVLITLAEKDKAHILEAARNFESMNFRIVATSGTARFLKEHGIHAEEIKKVYEGRPNIVDAIKNHEIQMVINTPKGKMSEHDDSYIRKSAIKYKIPYITTTSAALAATEGIRDRRSGEYTVKSLQEYHQDIDQ